MVKEETGKQTIVVCQMLLLPGTEVKQSKGRRETHGEDLSGNLTRRRGSSVRIWGRALQAESIVSTKALGHVWAQPGVQCCWNSVSEGWKQGLPLAW